MSLVCSQIQLQNLHPSLSPPFIPGQTGSTSHKWQWKKWHSLCYCPQYDWPEVAVPHLTAAEALAQPVEPPFPLPPASLQTLSIFPTCHHCLLLSTRNISFEIKGEKYPFKDYFQISQLCCLGLLGCCFFFCLCVSFLLELLSFALCYPALIMPCNLQNRSSWGWPDISLRSSDHTSLAFARREICSIQVPDERKILKKKKKKEGNLWFPLRLRDFNIQSSEVILKMSRQFSMPWGSVVPQVNDCLRFAHRPTRHPGSFILYRTWTLVGDPLWTIQHKVHSEVLMLQSLYLFFLRDFYPDPPSSAS